MIIIVAIVLLLIIIVPLSLLQLYLSRAKNKWLGLILPIIIISMSVVWSVTILSRSDLNNTIDQSHNQNSVDYDENGNLIEKIEKIDNEHRDTLAYASGPFTNSAVSVTFGFISMNIPTVIFLFIYGFSREKMRSKLEIQKMAIQDLN